MKAIVTTAFPGVPDGESMTRRIEVGEQIVGDLASVAVREGWALKIEAGEGVVDMKPDEPAKQESADPAVILAGKSRRKASLGKSAPAA
jgi:hypothetical protein